MIWRLELSDGANLRDRIAANVRRAVADGSLGAGERLPSAADLAAVLDVNVNTVLAAYRLLRSEGLLEFQRGRGVRVRPGSGDLASISQAVGRLVSLGARLGYSREDLARLVAGSSQGTDEA